VRRFLYWYLPLATAIAAAIVFGTGFYSYVRGDIGEPVNVATQTPAQTAPTAPRDAVVPMILGDSLARGAGDESGLGIGGRFVENLKRRRIASKGIVNLAINGARTADLISQLENSSVRTLLGESNAIIISIGGNDLWGDNMRNAQIRDPDAVMTAVLARMVTIVETVRKANPEARIYVIGLYNPFVKSIQGTILKPLIVRWNAKMAERFAADRNLVVVQTADLFEYHDRLSFDRFHPNGEGYELIARRIADSF
jgi:lysophospholipase L1-like esterase